MKKLLGIIIIVIFYTNISNALDIIISCDVKKVDDDLYEKNLGAPGQTKYFRIRESEVQSNWDQFNSRFVNWHYTIGIDNKYIKFYKWPGSNSETDDMQVIDRETGVMVTQNYIEQDKKYYALCNKIEENSLPVKKAKQKF